MESSDLEEHAEEGTTVHTAPDVMATVGAQRERWRAAAEEELSSFHTRDVYSPATPKQIKEGGRPLPMQCVWSKKKPDTHGRRRHRCRAVVCGNMEKSKEGHVLFTSQIDIATLLIVLRMAAWLCCDVMTVDIKAAFLYAPLPSESDPVLVRPPAPWVKLGLVSPDEICFFCTKRYKFYALLPALGGFIAIVSCRRCK